MEKPFSAACARNTAPILEVLEEVILPSDRRLLEIGSGTGQHAVNLASHFPWLEWYPTDLSDKLAGMKLWFQEAKNQNIQMPTRLDVARDDFPKLKFDIVLKPICEKVPKTKVSTWEGCSAPSAYYFFVKYSLV